MKLKLLTFLIVISGFILYIFQNNIIHKYDENLEQNNKEQKQEIKENIIKEEVMENESNNEPITNNKQDNNKTSGISSDSTSTTNKNDKKSDTNIDSNVVKEEVEFDSTQVESNSTQQENSSTKVENNSTQQEEKQTPWEELGITESDYYNKPMWSWARVDYSIEEYKTQELAQQKCIEDGNNMLDEILSFSCTTINSYSGDYLGEMLRVKY